MAAVIAPWNFPLAISMGMTSAALVTGNAVLYKPSPRSAVNGWQVFSILREAGIPDGVLNFIPGRDEVLGNHLMGHPGIDLIAFTGSRQVGLAIVESAGKTGPGQKGVKHTITEMGGKNAIIVDADADLDQAVAGTLQSAFGYAGAEMLRLFPGNRSGRLLRSIHGTTGGGGEGDPDRTSRRPEILHGAA